VRSTGPRVVIDFAVCVWLGGAVRHLVYFCGGDVTAIYGGSRGGEETTGRASGFGGACELRGDLLGGLLGVAVVGEKPLDAGLGRPGEGTRNIELVG
jgi:hypothetical protein